MISSTLLGNGQVELGNSKYSELDVTSLRAFIELTVVVAFDECYLEPQTELEAVLGL